MILGIDASNIRAGGGATHLYSLLGSAEPECFGFQKVILWSGSRNAKRIPSLPWLQVIHDPLLDGPLPLRLSWQQFFLPRLLRKWGCNILFSPGGIIPLNLRIQTVAVSQNMRPFDDQALSSYRLKNLDKRCHLRALRIMQSKSFERARGVIFLTEFAKRVILQKVKGLKAKTVVIPHGISPMFFNAPRPASSIQKCSREFPFRLLYVSGVQVYKNQWVVAEALSILRSKGYPVTIEFVGPPHLGMRRLNATLKKLDPESTYLRFRGPVPYLLLPRLYAEADGFVFASSCENMPNILIEAMASGLPIACSNRGPMPEILGEAGIYFDPEDATSISKVLEWFLNDEGLRNRCARRAFEAAHKYSWERCAKETFCFLAMICKENA